MNVEIIAIGDELTSGQRVDTNSAWLSQRLGAMGIPVTFHSTVADNEIACSGVFQAAMERAELVITTGGLGPTADDLTRQCLANASQRELVLDETQLANIQQIYARRGRDMPPQNRVQAMFPAGSQVVPNPHGTAPGIDLTVELEDRNCRVFCLPGVPAEMIEMWHQTIRPELIAAGASGKTIMHYRLKCFGMGESALEAALPDIIRRGRVPSVGITVHKATITLRITAEGDDESSCRAAMQPTIEEIHQHLGRVVFGEEDDELQDAVVRLLAARESTVATLEHGTTGLLSHWLDDADNAADVVAFAGGVNATADTLGDFIVPTGSQSAIQATLGEQVQRVRELMQADYGLAIGPWPTEDSAQAAVIIALSAAERLEFKMAGIGGHPSIVKERCVKQALDLLRLRLLTEQAS